MRKRLVYTCGLLLCAAVLTMTWFGSPRRDRITWPNVNRIKPGMTEAEVQEILGVPPGVYNADNPAFPSSPDAKHWVGPDGAGIGVWFDAQGKVRQTVLIPVDREMNSRRTAIGLLQNALKKLDY